MSSCRWLARSSMNAPGDRGEKEKGSRSTSTAWSRHSSAIQKRNNEARPRSPSISIERQCTTERRLRRRPGSLFAVARTLIMGGHSTRGTATIALNGRTDVHGDDEQLPRAGPGSRERPWAPGPLRWRAAGAGGGPPLPQRTGPDAGYPLLGPAPTL